MVNLSEKTRVTYVEPIIGCKAIFRWLNIAQRDAQVLLVLHQILGSDGEKFLHTAEQILAHYTCFKEHDVVDFKDLAKDLAGIYEERQDMGRAAFATWWLAERAKAKAAFGADAHGPVAFELVDSWVQEDLFQIEPSSTDEDGETKKRCTFCGTKPGRKNESDKKGRKLLACARCRNALYCDKLCQRLHWRKEHKTNCVAASSEDKCGSSGENEESNGAEGMADGDEVA
jgi:hypothetical protein